MAQTQRKTEKERTDLEWEGVQRVVGSLCWLHDSEVKNVAVIRLVDDQVGETG